MFLLGNKVFYVTAIFNEMVFTNIQENFVSNLTQVLNNDILSQRIYGEKLPFKG